MQTIQPIGRTPTNYEKLAIPTDAVIRLTEAYRIVAKAVFVTIESNNIRYRIDGGDPDANDGHVVVSGGNIYFTDVTSILNLRMIGSGGAAVAIVTYYI